MIPKVFERAIAFVVHIIAAAVALFSAYLCARMFPYIAHSLKVREGEWNAWPYSVTQPIDFELLPAGNNEYVKLAVDCMWNALLVAQFGLCHVGFARPAVYRAVGARYHRMIFMMVTCASYHVIMMLWRHHPNLMVWNAGPLIVSACTAIGIPLTLDLFNLLYPLLSVPFIILCLSTVFSLDVWFFLGARQPFMSVEQEKELNEAYEKEEKIKKAWYAAKKAGDGEPVPAAFGQKHLEVTGMYRWVRHPMYAWLQALCIISPIMTFDRLCYFLFTTALLSVGLRFEEQKLLREFGAQYREYMKRTPMLFPVSCGRREKEEEKKE